MNQVAAIEGFSTETVVSGDQSVIVNGREVWGASRSSIAGNLMTFGRALGGLELPHGIGHDDPKDRVTAPQVLPKLYMVPKFWKADGYGRLTDHLKEREEKDLEFRLCQVCEAM